jgi:hypothetical protein
LLTKRTYMKSSCWLLPLFNIISLYIGHVWIEVLVLVCSKLTPKLTLWSQTHVLVGTNTPKKLTPPRGENWCYFGGPHLFSLFLSFFKSLKKLLQMQTNTSIQTSKELVFYVLV